MAGIAHYPAVQRFGQVVGHLSKRVFRRVLDFVLPVPANVTLDSIGEVRSVLLVRPNFRIGNTLITSPLVPALRRRFPAARLDYLTGDTTASLLAHLPIDAVHVVSRRFILRPWQFVALFLRLRRVHYDLAVEAGIGSFSGGLYGFLSGARHRAGCGGKGDRFLDIRLPRVTTEHVYDSPAAFARLFGANDCLNRPLYIVSEEERAQARAVLREHGLAASNGDVHPFIAIFVGGHLEKRWPTQDWLALARSLADAGGRVAVFVGPEEMHFADRIRDALAGKVSMITPKPLRVFAGMWSMATLIVTPDSGPMHLAAALGVPMIAVLQREQSLIYRPRATEDVTLLRPPVEAVLRAVKAHPRWRETSNVEDRVSR